MTLALDRHQGLLSEGDEQIGLECPYCNVYSHMTPQSIPNAADLIETRPRHVGLVYQCDACHAPVFLRFATKSFSDDRVELYRNFVELERPKERFAYSYLPKHTEVLFREALSCYSAATSMHSHRCAGARPSALTPRSARAVSCERSRK